jgi:hypothetical protein
MDQSVEPAGGVIIAIYPASLSADQTDRLVEQRVLYPQQTIEIPLAEILENISGLEDIKGVEIEVTAFYRNILSKPSKKHEVILLFIYN